MDQGGLTGPPFLMHLDTLLATVPAHANDLKLNLTHLLGQAELTPQQAWGTAVASAITARNAQLLAAVTESAGNQLKPEALAAARAAAAIMGMNNIYFRFLHLAQNKNYGAMRARLRMNALRTHGIEPVDFELFCIAASAINGCGDCIDAHEKLAREKGASEEMVLAAVRLASVIHGLATVLDSEPA